MHALVLIDDHDDTREIASEILRMSGFEVREFATAEAALEAVRADLPSAVITDLTLGEMGGEELARLLRGASETRSVTLVALTGHVDARANTERLWDEVLIKPVDPFELARRVRVLVESRERR